jgi:hypothetical protein
MNGGDTEAKDKDMVSTPESVMFIDHDKQRRGQMVSSNSLQDPDSDCATDELGHVDFTACHNNTPGEPSIFGFQDVCNPDNRRFNSQQLPDHAWNATQDGETGLDNVHLATDGLQLTSTGNTWPHDHPTLVENIIQQDYEFMLNLQYDYHRSSVEVGLQGEPQQGHNSPSMAANVQDIIQHNIDDRLSALNVQDIIQHDYGSLFDTQEDIAMETLTGQVEPTTWPMGME